VNPPQLPLRIQTKSLSSSRVIQGSSQTNLHSSMTSPTDTISPNSAVRSSMDMGFRIRSRSETDHRPREESVREARRKFEEREQIKDERAAREAVKAIEKQNLKDARQMEKGRRSTASEGSRSKRSKSDLLAHEKGDKFVGRDYNSVPLQTPPHTADTVDPPRGSRTTTSTTKKKTHSAWTTFMMWLRTRFLRMARTSSRKP